MKSIFQKHIWLFCLIALLGCDGTKTLSEDERLYVGSVIENNPRYDDTAGKMKDYKASDKVAGALADLPNGALFGMPNIRFIPVRLLLYNAFDNEKDKGFGTWMQKNFGQEPVTVSDVDPELKVRKGINIYEKYGHFGTEGSYQLVPRKNDKKVKIVYTFNVPEPYRYRNISFETGGTTEEVRDIMEQYAGESALEIGDAYNLDILKAERSSIMEYFQNRGYYFFKEEDVILEADTSIGASRAMDLRVSLDTTVDDAVYAPQDIRSVTIQIDSIGQKATGDRFYSWGDGRIKRRLIDSLITVRSGQLYNVAHTRASLRKLSELRVFANPRIRYVPSCVDSTCLDARISMNSLDLSLLSANVRGNYKNIGYLGPSIGIGLEQLNIFQGAEKLSVDLDFFYDFPFGVFNNRVTQSSGFRVGIEMASPLLRPPITLWSDPIELPRQHYSVDFDFNRRRDFFQIASWTLGYDWQWRSSEKLSHRIGLIGVNSTQIRRATSRFDTLLAENPLLRETLQDQIILSSSYNLIFDNSSLGPDKQLGVYFDGEIELAGNALNAISGVFGSRPNGERKLFGVPFAQYVRFDSDIRLYYRLGQHSQLVFRNLFGLGMAYGNANEMPYIKQFFIGGANSLRPINARSVGPGQYFEDDRGEVNQVGDLKIEWNLEYRAKIAGPIHGALWTDVGNIWLLEEDPNRPFSGIDWGNLLRDSYVTAGAGLRLDLDFLVVRLDYGFVMYAPSFDTGERWIWEYGKALKGAVLGFGYPF